jgi:hypothetical protein
LTPETQQRVREVAEWHDQSLNWDYPPDPGPWREDECACFNTAVRALYAVAVRELGAPYELIFAAPDEGPEASGSLACIVRAHGG